MPNFTFNPQLFGQMMNNPVQFLLSKKLNVPQDIGNDPKAMVEHLMRTGQMNQTTYNELNAFRKQMEERMKS